MSKDKSGPAYPEQKGHYFSTGENTSSEIETTPGMTKRERFAMAAMQEVLKSMLFRSEGWNALTDSEEYGSLEGEEIISKFACQIADALLKELEK